jgi:hypothetical protein
MMPVVELGSCFATQEAHVSDARALGTSRVMMARTIAITNEHCMLLKLWRKPVQGMHCRNSCNNSATEKKSQKIVAPPKHPQNIADNRRNRCSAWIQCNSHQKLYRYHDDAKKDIVQRCEKAPRKRGERHRRKRAQTPAML